MCSPNSVISERIKKENARDIYIRNDWRMGFMSITAKTLLFFMKVLKFN